MKLQLALDMLSTDAALEIATEVEAFIDIIEVGTPLIKHEGIGVVKRLRARFPNKLLLVDLKTMDVGKYEADFVFDQGADLVTVLGVADNATILGAIHSAENHKRSVVVDLINVVNKVERAEFVKQLGADFIAIHSGIDQQHQGESPLKDLQRIKSAIASGVMVAGGINMASLPSIAALKPDVIIVGGAITSALKPAQVAQEMAAIMASYHG
jgi:3-hexulose-6-phosphate synthase